MSLAEVKASLPIQAVTVFPQSALIRRRGRIKLLAGEAKVFLSGLPGELTPESVRVAVEPAEGLQILDVAAEERLLEPEGSRQYEKLKAKYDELLAERHRHEAHLANSLSELALFLDKDGLAERIEGEIFLPVNVGNWREFFNFLRERLGENRALYREYLFALIDLEQKISAASANLARCQGEIRQTHDITVTVAAPREAEYSLALEHLQEGVSWYPVYSVSGEPGQRTLSVTLSAVVAQSTGEDWRGVELLLSTAVPRFSCSLPVLLSKRLRERDAEIEMRKARERSDMSNKPAEAVSEEAYGEQGMLADEKEAPVARAAASMKKAKAMGRKMPMAESAGGAERAKTTPAPPASALAPASAIIHRGKRDEAAPEQSAAVADALQSAVSSFEAELGGAAGASRAEPYADELLRLTEALSVEVRAEEEEPAAVPGWMSRGVSPLQSLGGYDYRFPVPGRRDIPSSPVPKKVPVARKELPVSFVYVTVPAVKPAVFLRAHFDNDAENPLPAGPAQIFAGENLIGSLFFETLSPGEKGALSLGAERDIKVLRRENTALRRRGVVSKEKITDVSVEIELLSFRNEPVEIEVLDRLPLSLQPKEITVADFKASPSPRVTGRKVLFWKLGLKPREKTVIQFSYSIRHPENFRLVLEEESAPHREGEV